MTPGDELGADVGTVLGEAEISVEKWPLGRVPGRIAHGDPPTDLRRPAARIDAHSRGLQHLRIAANQPQTHADQRFVHRRCDFGPMRLVAWMEPRAHRASTVAGTWWFTVPHPSLHAGYDNCFPRT